MAYFWPMTGSLRGEETPRENAQMSRERIILLNSGRIMTGQVERNAGGYLIHQNSGRVQLALDDVKFIVDSLRDGYYKQRDSVVEPTPATHLALANWCISYRLYDEASVELKKCLETDPDNEAARRLLARLTDTIRANLTPTPDVPVARKGSDGYIQPEVETLGGLSRESAVQFTMQIQPLLLNKCGNASCHGMSSENEFHLISSRGSGHGARQTSEQNLSEVLRQIDFEKVSQSKLLSVMRTAHGGKGTVFAGQNARDQMNRLQTWVRTVVNEKQAESIAMEQQPRIASRGKSKKRDQQFRVKNEKTNEAPIRQVSATQEVENEQPEAGRAVEPKLLRADPKDAAALAREPEDAFDPQQFNERFRRR